ncbi:MAG: transposase [Chloracidobacterium sp.]|nr:transposase [Chloracidobacterium sp.]
MSRIRSRQQVIAQAKIKTDKIDARVLAELARVGYLPEVWLPDEDTEALRQFITTGHRWSGDRTECKNSVHSILHRNLVRQTKTDLFGTGGRLWLESIVAGTSADGLLIPEPDRLRMGSPLNEIDRIDALVADLESVIASYIAVRPHLKEQLDRLLSITGVDLAVAAGLIANDRRCLAFLIRRSSWPILALSHRLYQSGDSSRNGRITKQGRAEARWLSSRPPNICGSRPVRYVHSSHVSPRNALQCRCRRVVARKLIELVHHLLTHNEDYIYRLPPDTGKSVPVSDSRT